MQVEELANAICDAKATALAIRRRNVWEGDNRDIGNPILKELEWVTKGLQRGLQKETIKVRVECPTYPGVLFDGQLQAPALRLDQPVAFIYDGRHSSVDLLTHDAQNCEFLVDANDGTWHRCRPIMPCHAGGQMRQLHQAAKRMSKAVDEVQDNIHTFAESASHSAHRHNFIEAGPHTDELLHAMARKSQKSITRVSSFLSDRHGHRNPTNNGMHEHHS